MRLIRLVARYRPFAVVWLSVLITLAGIGMVSPLLPRFAEDMGASGAWLGLIFSGYAFTQVPLMPVVGRLSDRFGKKLFLLLGLLLYVGAAAGYLWAPGYRELFLFRLVSGAGAAMVVPTAYAYVGDLTPRGSEGRYMGVFNIAMVAGYGLGPTLGGLIYDAFGMEATFTSMCIMSGAGALVVLLFLPSIAPPAAAEASDGPSPGRWALVRDPTMQAVVVYIAAWGLAYGAVSTFLPLFLTEVRGASLAQVGIVLSVRSLLNGTLNYPYGRLADRFSRRLLVTVGLAAMGLGICLIPRVGGFAGVLGVFCGMGILETVAMPAASAINVETGRRLGMGSVMALFNMSNSVAVIAGSMAGAGIEGAAGISWVFPAAAGAVVMGAGGFNLLMARASRR